MTIRRIVGVLLLAFGGVSAVVHALGLIDPAGAQLADDGDPFGRRPPWQYGAVGLILSLAVAGIGVWLTYSRRPR